MTTVVSYRIYCSDCSRDTVIREQFIGDDSHPWKVQNKRSHDGLCPVCNPVINEANAEFDDSDIEIELTELKGVGQATADTLREYGIVTKGDVRSVTVDELRDLDGVGDTTIASLMNAA
jgi:hypothetical protein